MNTPSEITRRIAIDARLAVLHAEIAQLGSERNRLAPIHKVPEEILCHVFSLLPRLDATIFVCSRWSRLALSSPVLWRDVELANWDTKRVLAAERYSQNRLQHLTIRSLNKPLNDADESALRHLAPRLLSLSITGQQRPLDQLGLALGRYMDLPHLANLAVICREETEDTPVLYLRPMPALTTLRLKGVRVSYSHWTAFADLTVLEMDHPLAVNILFAALAQSPRLEVLNVGTWPSSGPALQLEDLHLPLLREFAFRQRPSDFGVFWKHIIIPATTKVRFTSAHYISRNDLDPIIALAKEHLARPGVPACDTLSLLSLSSYNYSITLSSGFGTPPIFALDIPTTDLFEVLGGVINTLCLPTVSQVYVDQRDYRAAHSEDWREVFRPEQLVQLETLYLGFPLYSSEYGNVYSSLDASLVVCCPDLQHIVIEVAPSAGTMSELYGDDTSLLEWIQTLVEEMTPSVLSTITITIRGATEAQKRAVLDSRHVTAVRDFVWEERAA
ncbi:F-box domain-containing protein [Mycena kentingensis (nom. inval.)]|nr:F-box domain-containing protein [Mycena kentingensis (nom. inval.)]